MDFRMDLTNLLKNIKSNKDKEYFNQYYNTLNKYIDIETNLIKINEELVNLIKDKYDIIIQDDNVDKKIEKNLYNSYNDLTNNIIKIQEDMLHNKINFIKLIQLYKK